MKDRVVLKLQKWPFLLGDLLLLGVAGLVFWQSGRPMDIQEMLVLAGCVAFGAALGITPFVLEYGYLSKLTQVERLQRALLQIHNIETVGRQVASATAGWQAVQDDATKAVEAARQINESMTNEAHAFKLFLEKANDSERQHLRLEVDKLRRAEADWLRMLVRIMDHVHALFQAATRSGQPALIDQLRGFQRACRDATLRVGLVQFEAKQGDKFDAQLHQSAQDNGVPAPDAVVMETLAPGYRFQAQTIRRALVALQEDRQPAPPSIDQNVNPSSREWAHADPASFSGTGDETVSDDAPQ
jgi:molecular chaperone GrpE (heat shock protein)